jgi:PilZ domain
VRQYIRHPTSIPIKICAGDQPVGALTVQDISSGGLCFETSEVVQVGAAIDFQIPAVAPDFMCRGKVVWRRMQSPTRYEIGVCFESTQDYFLTRMVEQVCQIEAYRLEVEAGEGRVLTGEEAALEWISNYAKEFDPEK